MNWMWWSLGVIAIITCEVLKQKGLNKKRRAITHAGREVPLFLLRERFVVSSIPGFTFPTTVCWLGLYVRPQRQAIGVVLRHQPFNWPPWLLFLYPLSCRIWIIAPRKAVTRPRSADRLPADRAASLCSPAAQTAFSCQQDMWLCAQDPFREIKSLRWTNRLIQFHWGEPLEGDGCHNTESQVRKTFLKAASDI
jgi:hypothetical protein